MLLQRSERPEKKAPAKNASLRPDILPIDSGERRLQVVNEIDEATEVEVELDDEVDGEVDGEL